MLGTPRVDGRDGWAVRGTLAPSGTRSSSAAGERQAGGVVRVPVGRSRVVGVVLVVVAGFAAAACLLTGLLLDDDGAGRSEGGLYQAVRVAWLLAAGALTAVGALAWSRSRGADRPRSLLVAAASTAVWTGVAVLAGWDPVR